jgi:hypothetical protein
MFVAPFANIENFGVNLISFLSKVFRSDSQDFTDSMQSRVPTAPNPDLVCNVLDSFTCFYYSDFKQTRRGLT